MLYSVFFKTVKKMFRKDMQKKFHNTFTNLNNAYVIKVRVSPTNEIAQPT